MDLPSYDPGRRRTLVTIPLRFGPFMDRRLKRPQRALAGFLFHPLTLQSG
jgi:hypothetical protein